jgi:hypothetical protein
VIKKLIGLAIVVLLLLSLFACDTSDENTVLEDGFVLEEGGDRTPPEKPYPYFRIYSAYRFSKRKFNIDDVTVQFYFGHELSNTDLRFNVQAETEIIWSKSSLEHIFIKQVDNFLTDDYAATMTWIDAVNNIQKVDFIHSETIKIPRDAFEGASGMMHVSGKYRVGRIDIGIYSDITDENVEVLVRNFGDGFKESRGWGSSGVMIYYSLDIKSGTVTIGKDMSVYPRGKYIVECMDGYWEF